MPSHNQRVLAELQAQVAIARAQRAHAPQPMQPMDALREAIDSKRGEVEALIFAGEFDSAAFRLAKAQLARWTAAWSSSR